MSRSNGRPTLGKNRNWGGAFGVTPNLPCDAKDENHDEHDED